MERFWMVYGMGQGSPTRRHPSLSSARTEAERLARTCPSVEFYVLEAVGCAKKVDVTFVDLRDPPACDFRGDNPF